MKTKIATNVKQSKELAKILPVESADMSWTSIYDENHLMPYYRLDILPYKLNSAISIPAWSLSALLHILPKVNGKYPELLRGKETGLFYMWIEDMFDTQTYVDPIDAVMEMIEYLKEKDLI